MAYELKSARYLAAEILRAVLAPGDRAIDATMGNGHDTALLCSLVGPEGRVYAFDVQPAALEATRRRLAEEGSAGQAELFLLGHEHMWEAVGEPVKAIVFNLGWLPGGDHRITTLTETTLPAIQQALALLMPMGVLVICVYPGHPEGEREQEMLTRLLSSLSPREYNVLMQQFLNAGAGAPLCFAVQKQRGAEPRA
ncbi:MAG: rRNA methyltransferase [Clostridia bacterium]|nr:rRNA methyltransferase [Clostridia bacterium]